MSGLLFSMVFAGENWWFILAWLNFCRYAGLVRPLRPMTESRLSEGTIDGYIRSFADHFKTVHSRLGDLAQVAEISHFDETGMRVEGSLKWFHIGHD